MTSFVGLGQVYDAIMGDGMSRTFQSLALVLMGFRFMLCIQYSVVLFFVHGFQKTLVPLLLMVLVHFLAAIGFLIVYVTDVGVTLTGDQGAVHLTRCYIIIAVEALAVIIISSIWRVLSFRHTHLVERVGILTLIVIGEGILGMSKAVAYVLMGTSVTVGPVVGLVAGAVALIVSSTHASL